MVRLAHLIRSLKPRLIEHRVMLSIFFWAVGGFVYHINTTFGNLISLLSGLYFLSLLLIRPKSTPLRGKMLFLYSFFCIWLFILCIRLVLFDDNNIINMPFHQMMLFLSGNLVFPSLMPFVLLIINKNRYIDLGYLFRMMVLMLVIYAIIYPFAFHNMINFQWDPYAYLGEGSYQDFISNSTLGIGAFCPIILMVYLKKYLPDKLWWFFLASTLGTLAMTMFMARRGGTVTDIMYLVLCWWMYMTFDKKSSKLLQFFFAVIVVIACFYLFVNLQDSFFSLLVERGTTDSRSGVEENFYQDMTSAADWIFGRGLAGTYYDASFGMQRSAIETGYLALILRGGIVYLALYVGLLLFSGIKGLFKSKNILVKSVAIIMLGSILELYPWGWPQFTFKFFVIWCGVIICNSNRYLKMTDEQVGSEFFSWCRK